MRELLQRQRELCVEVRHLARVGEEREPERRIRGLREHAMRRGAGRHSIAGGERLLPGAEVLVRAGEDDLDLAEEGRDDIGEAHGRAA